MADVNNIRKTVKGLIMPIPAVFDGKGEPDLAMMEKLTDWYLHAGVHGFFILGSQGQGPACRIDQPQPVNTIRHVMKAVITEFISDIKQNQSTAGHTNGQPGNVDDRKYLVSPYISHCNFEIAFEHGIPLF